MERAIIIRYAEIHLKGRNRPIFERALLKNIENALQGITHTLTKMHGREVVSGYDEIDEQEIVARLSKVAGIHSFSVCMVVKTSVENIKNGVLKLADKIDGTFKVETNRADKTFPFASNIFSAEVGGLLLDSNKNLMVKLDNPETVVHIDIREEGQTFIFLNSKPGIGGMPVSTAGKGLLLLSGGIDSPVAGFMACKRGVKLCAVHFESPPYTNEGARQKVMNLAKIISRYNGGDMKVFVVSTTKIQEMIHNKCNPEFGITLLRRFMLQIAEKIAMNNECKMLVTGESLGQVASQTIESMTTISEAMKTNIPVIKPLVCFDKEETISLAKQIDTFNISIEPFADCCTVFLPKDPATKPKLEKVKKEEARLDVDGLINEAIENMQIVTIKS